MSDNRRSAPVFWRGLLLVAALCLITTGIASALPLQGHISVQKQYGPTTEASSIIHSEIIDKVPWRDKAGGWNHRELWGHSDKWFYDGGGPKAEWLKDIEANLRRQHPSWTNKSIAAEVQKVYKKYASMSGQKLIAGELMQRIPSLTKKEAYALAEWHHFAHNLGDSTTPEGLIGVDMERGKRILLSPSNDVISGLNKDALTKAINAQGDKFSAADFVRQPRNFELLKVEQLAQKGFKIFNPASPNNIGITVNGENYIVKANWKDAAKAIEQSPSAKVFLADDVYTKGAGRYPELAGKVVPESQVTGVKATLAEQQENVQLFAEKKATEIRTAEADKTAAMGKQMRQSGKSLRKIAPYALAGGLMALSENWETLTDAWDGKSTWAKALTRTGVDFAGYTVIPYVVDGVLTQVAGKSVIAASLKNAGMGYTIGFFIWNAGKEYLAYQMGDISQEEFVTRMKQRGAQVGREASMVPVNMLLYKLISPTAGTFVVPLVIIGGSFAIQRVQNWYEDKVWMETIYLDDVKAMLGEDLINEFTLITPETRSSLADPERRANLAEPEERHSLANPEERPSF